MSIPRVNRSQIQKLDKLLIEEYGIPVTVLMEHAGYRLAEYVRSHFPQGQVLLCIGKGNNGGDGLVAARHLQNFGYEVALFMVSDAVSGDPALFFRLARAQGIRYWRSIAKLSDLLATSDVVVDCLLGYNLQGNPYGKIASAIRRIHQARAPVVSCDVPSGVDCDTGTAYSPYVEADHILSMALPRLGCRGVNAKEAVADIGVPLKVYRRIGVKPAHYFSGASIIPV